MVLHRPVETTALIGEVKYWDRACPVTRLHSQVDRHGASSFGLTLDVLGLDHFSAYSQCIVGVALAMVCALAK